MMVWFKSLYDPVGTETFRFFGEPQPAPYRSPVKQFFADIKTLFTKVTLIGLILSTFYTRRSIDELYLWAWTVLSLAWFTFWSLVQIPAVLTTLSCFVIIAAVLSLVTTVHAKLIWLIVQGPAIQVYPDCLPHGYDSSQRWIYINGIATGATITHQNLEYLSKTFHNPVLAINNRTYGFMGDVLECIVQRAFGYRTEETVQATEIIKSYLTGDESIKKVVLIAHSQGGIIASQILDDLYCDLCPEELGKLEVYTFGSAALTFRNPFKDKKHEERMIPVMEHYCNEKDMVTAWGALASKTDLKRTPFIGKVFVFKGQTGHMLNQHYLKYMFTGPPAEWREGNFLLRAVKRDALIQDDNIGDKFYVTGRDANIAKGEESVKSVSNLWRYLEEPKQP